MGIDMEPERRLPGDLVAQICGPDEIAVTDDETALLRFVAKEAFYKAYFPRTRSFLDFHDVHVDLDLSQGSFQAHVVTPGKPALANRRFFAGRLTRLTSHIVAALWITN
jgi:4'-phosphopantetheinyl transferase EntD